LNEAWDQLCSDWCRYGKYNQRKSNAAKEQNRLASGLIGVQIQQTQSTQMNDEMKIKINSPGERFHSSALKAIHFHKNE